MFGVGSHADAQGGTDIQPGTALVHRALSELPGYISGPASSLLP